MEWERERMKEKEWKTKEENMKWYEGKKGEREEEREKGMGKEGQKGRKVCVSKFMTIMTKLF